MPRADVVVIGAGLAGLACATELAERGASVFLAAKGMATTHWTHGGLDLAAPAGARTARDGLRMLAALDGHPYRELADDLAPAVDEQLSRLAADGLPYDGGIDAPLVQIPTAIGALRPAALLPAAQATALQPWCGDELVLVGFRHYRDAWPAYAARNLRAATWPDGPSAIRAVEVELPGEAGLRNLAAQNLARLFDRAEWRASALESIARALPPAAGRVGLPAVLGLDDHPAALADAARILGRPVIEIPSLPPSVPGMRLFEVFRRRLLGSGARLQIGFDVVDVERDGRQVRAVHTEAASRTLRLAADAFVLATGGIAGEGIRAGHDGALVERVFSLPVSAPPRDAWFSADPLVRHPLEKAGIMVDAQLRPPDLDNVNVIGSALAGMHYLDQRCGDGVALASARRAARSLAGAREVAA